MLHDELDRVEILRAWIPQVDRVQVRKPYSRMLRQYTSDPDLLDKVTMTLDEGCRVEPLLFQVDIIPDDWETHLIPRLGDACAGREATQREVGGHKREDLDDLQRMGGWHELMGD